MNYIWDPDSRIYRSDSAQDFNYSDGEEAERRLYKIISGVKDRSTLSPELANQITDWPSEYHLSRSRHCILRPLGIRPEQRVLELGCGCGAITRYLGEIGAQVVSVEGSIHRAKIAAERCKDLKNVSIYAADLGAKALEILSGARSAALATARPAGFSTFTGFVACAILFSTSAVPVLPARPATLDPPDSSVDISAAKPTGSVASVFLKASYEP